MPYILSTVLIGCARWNLYDTVNAYMFALWHLYGKDFRSRPHLGTRDIDDTAFAKQISKMIV